MLKVLAANKKQIFRDQVFPYIQSGTKSLDGKRADFVDISAQMRTKQDVEDVIKFLEVTKLCFLDPANKEWKDHAAEQE